MKRLVWLLWVLPLAGCELDILGTKTKDAEAMGYACRVSKKSPEQCMRENTAFSQSSILDGWRAADKDVKDKKVDTTFTPPPRPEGEAKPEGEPKPATDQKPPEGEQKPASEVKPAAESKPTPEQKPAQPAAKGH